MAEVVSEMQERMLPEYEQMKKHQVLDDDQIRECVRKRVNLGFKITQNKRTIKSYMEFIIYEKQLHKLIAEKEKLLNVNLAGLKASMATRIIRLYREALQRFPHDDRFWSNYLEFLKKSVPNEATGAYEKMLTFHGDKPNYWCDAAIWTYEYSKNVPRVKEIFLRALQRHPASERIYKSFFLIMLNEAIKMKNERNLAENTISEQDIGMERVEALYRNAKSQIKEVEFFLELLACCEDPKFVDITAKLQMTILRDLQTRCPRSEALWHVLAQREFRGLSITDLEMLGVEDKNEETADENKVEGSSPWKQRTLKQRIEQGCKIYQVAVTTLNTTRMWSLYINSMLQLNQDMSVQANLKRKCLATAFKDGHNSHLMDVKHYLAYRNMLLATPDGTKTAARMLTEAFEHNHCIELCEQLLEVYIADNNEDEVDKLFVRAKKDFGTKAHPIWTRVISFYKLDNSNEGNQRVLALYREGCEIQSQDFVALRCDYLQFCMLVDSIALARKVYAEVMNMPPFNLAVHKKMAELEATLEEHKPEDIKHWRQVHEYMTVFFGATSSEVWLDIIKFEREHGDCKQVPKLYERAKHALKPEYLTGFVDAFALQQTLLLC